MTDGKVDSVIDEAIIPRANRQYLDGAFWEQRYAQHVKPDGDEDLITREWLGDYSLFADVFRKYVPRSASILILGCGNSLLGEELFDDGYRNVHNTDISESVISLMAGHCHKCAQLKWSTMDCRELAFADHQFDVVIEKATIEVFFVEEASLWSVSEETLRNVRQIANEIARVLKPSVGQFFSISFTAPHFRKELFAKMFLEGTMTIANVHTLGEHFHYYLYHLSNDPECQQASIFSYEPPKVTKCSTIAVGGDDHQDSEQFLFSISP